MRLYGKILINLRTNKLYCSFSFPELIVDNQKIVYITETVSFELETRKNYFYVECLFMSQKIMQIMRKAGLLNVFRNNEIKKFSLL